MVNVVTIRKSLGTLGSAILGNAARWTRVMGPAHSLLIYLYGHEHQSNRSDALASRLMVTTLATGKIIPLTVADTGGNSVMLGREWAITQAVTRGVIA